MERCAYFHGDFHIQTENGLWYCEYCRQRRENALSARALLLRVKLGITDLRAGDMPGGLL